MAKRLGSPTDEYSQDKHIIHLINIESIEYKYINIISYIYRL